MLGCGAQAVLYRCRRCRRIVASSANAIPVENGDGAFRGKRRDRQGRGARPAVAWNSLSPSTDLCRTLPHAVSALSCMDRAWPWCFAWRFTPRTL